jgi:hypothetical protein
MKNHNAMDYPPKIPVAFIVCIFLFLSAPAAAYDTEDAPKTPFPSLYSPTDMNAVWYYKYYEKAKPQDVKRISAKILNKETIDGREYYCYFVPAKDMKNIVRLDESGAYIRSMKYPVPFLNFIDFEAVLTPEIRFLKFPFTVGEEWECDSEVRAEVFGVIKFVKKVRAKFKVIGRDYVQAGERKVKTYKIRIMISIDNGPWEMSEQWYGKGVGYIYDEDWKYRLELERFEIKR